MRAHTIGMLALALLLPVMPASAVSFSFDGYGDLRTVFPAKEQGWLAGGLGKTRYDSSGGNDPSFELAELFGQATVLLTPDLTVVANIRIEQDQLTFIDTLEDYIRYRPVSLTPWRWSVKAGAFFPPISLENDEIGWTSSWTLTPSAINTWVGEEFRTIGAEGTLEWRRETGTATFRGAIFGYNDPAGIMVAERGWALGDRPTGLNEHLRLPNGGFRRNTFIFKEIDERPGWYGGLSWEENDFGKLEILYYDNRADPTAIRGQVAWETRFWSIGAKTSFDEFTLIAQGMTGKTFIYPSPYFESDTRYNAAFVLLGWQRDQWKVAGRVDAFSNTEVSEPFTVPWNEHGYALTADVSWAPYEWVRLSAEALSVTSTRTQRRAFGIDPRQTDNQFQLSARFYL